MEEETTIIAEDGEWVKKTGITFGNGSGKTNKSQAYWYHVSTGKTSWIAPTPAAATAPVTTTEEGRRTVVNDIIKAEEDEEGMIHLLRLLEQAIQKGGSDEEWQDLIKADDAALLRKIVSLLLPPPASASIQDQASRILLLFLGLFPDKRRFWHDFFNHSSLSSAGARAGAAVVFLDGAAISALRRLTTAAARVGGGGEEAVDVKDDSIPESRQVWLTLMSKVLSFFPSSHAKEEEKERFTELLLLGEKGEGAQIVRDMVEMACRILETRDAQEGEAMAAAKLLVVLHSITIMTKKTKKSGASSDHDALNVAIEAVRQSSHVIEMILHDLNAHGFPNHEMEDEGGGGGGGANETKCLLTFLSSILEEEDQGHAFHRSDIHVMLDIIIRELHNLPSGHDLLPDYLACLGCIVGSRKEEKSLWKKDKYKKTEMHQVLEILVNLSNTAAAGGGSGAGGEGSKQETIQCLAQSILDCI